MPNRRLSLKPRLSSLLSGVKNAAFPALLRQTTTFDPTTTKHLLHPLFALLASVTGQELARQVAYLKEANRILRSRLPKHVNVTAKEHQRLIKLGKKLGAQLRELISNVSEGSFLRWIREATGQTPLQGKRKPGRPRTPDEIQERVLKLARENDGE